MDNEHKRYFPVAEFTIAELDNDNSVSKKVQDLTGFIFIVLTFISGFLVGWAVK